MKQKAVSNIMQNHSNFAFWGRQGVGRWEDTFEEEGWIGLNSIVWMWYGFQKTKLSFLSGVICRGSNSLVVVCVTLNLAHPPCFVLQSGSGYLVVVFVYVTEFAGMKSRTWASIHLHSFFAFGTMVVALTGYFVRTWWIYQIVLSSVTVPFILCCWMLPETPFWLISGGKYEEAQKVIDTMAKWNRTRSCKLSELLSLDHDGSAGNKPSQVEKHTLSELFYDWSIGARTLILWLIWFTGCLGFYTFSLNSVHLGGSEYLNLFLMGKWLNYIKCSCEVKFLPGFESISIVFISTRNNTAS